jgi:hypothetical protein
MWPPLHWPISWESLPGVGTKPKLEFLKRLWGLGTEEEEGYHTGLQNYVGWRNSFLGIDSGAPYKYKNTSSVLTCIQWISQHRNYNNFKVLVLVLVLWITDLQVSGFSSVRVLVFLLVPLLALGYSLTLGFVNHRLTSIWIFLRPVLVFRTVQGFHPKTSPIKAYTWVDCGHNPPFSIIMKVGGVTCGWKLYIFHYSYVLTLVFYGGTLSF